MIKLKMVFAVLALCVIHSYAFAATYYVDALNGNDRWSGKAQSPSGSTDGPWQSLKKISDSTFQPGDAILLKCGQTWFETLQLRSNGAPDRPITVSSYPAGCPAKPVVEGAITIPAKSWSSSGGSIYEAQLPVDLLASVPLDTNGWKIWSPNGDAVLSSSNACDYFSLPCLAATSGASGSPAIVSSYNFPLNPSAPHLVRFAAKAPLGVKYLATIRRSLPPWDIVGFKQVMVGTGTWETYVFQFTATTSLPTARLDFEIPSGRVQFAMTDPRVEFQNSPVLEAYADGGALSVAHHPNAGHDPQFPDSVYFNIAANSSRNAGNGSNYLKTDSDLNFPEGGWITPGQTVHIRSASWRLDERRITSFNGETIFFDEPSRYSPKKGYGYYLTGSLWMLDEPGEWHYDAGKRVFHVWMPDDQMPRERVSLSVLATGVDLSNRAHVVIDGLSIHQTGMGINMVNSTGITVRNSFISDTAREGIDISGASTGVIHANRIAKTGRDAIARSGRYPNDMTITDNVVSQSAVRILFNGQRSLPVYSVQAIPSGTNGNVSGNIVTQTAYNGIYADPGSRVTSNLVQETCMLLDDCAGIYTFGSDNNSTISNNLILNIIGNNNGTARNVHSPGIYLDEPSSGNTVAGNTVAFSEYGIQLHNAYNNLVENNTLFSSRTYELWLQEDDNQIRAAGDIFGNKIRSNHLIPTATSQSVSQETRFSTTVNFATYDLNSYSTLANRYVSREKWAAGDILHTFEAWQSADSLGKARNLDPNGRQITQSGYTSFEVAGANMIEDGSFSDGPLKWQAWNEVSPKAQISVQSDGSAHWLTLVAGGSPSLVASQNFGVVEGEWYRLSFDMRAGKDNQKLQVAPRRGGGGDNGYELITDAHTVYGSMNWKRYSMLFKANKTVNYRDPATGDLGARIDFQHLPPGGYIQLARVELVPLRSVGTQLRTALLHNPTRKEAPIDCPDLDVMPEACTHYVRFPDGQPITWPHDLPAFGSQVIYTRDASAPDTDSDGIADYQDSCPETPRGHVTNSKGCALAESPT